MTARAERRATDDDLRRITALEQRIDDLLAQCADVQHANNQLIHRTAHQRDTKETP